MRPIASWLALSRDTILMISLRSIRPLFWTTATRNRCARRNAPGRWKRMWIVTVVAGGVG